jgi:hypothetical protein
MAKKPVVVPPPQQEDELTVTVFRFRGSSESMQKGFEAFGAALGAALGTVVPPARQVGGNGRKAQAQLAPSTETPEDVEQENEEQQDESTAYETSAVPSPPKAKKEPGKPKYSFLDDFNLTPEGVPSLVEFCGPKNATTEQDRYLVVCLWLQTHGGADPFTGNDVFTCFRALEWKPRLDVMQPVRELKSKKSWFASPGFGKWRLTQPGITAAQAVGQG